jgi:hypothetical protein
MARGLGKHHQPHLPGWQLREQRWRLLRRQRACISSARWPPKLLLWRRPSPEGAGEACCCSSCLEEWRDTSPSSPAAAVCCCQDDCCSTELVRRSPAPSELVRRRPDPDAEGAGAGVACGSSTNGPGGAGAAAARGVPEVVPSSAAVLLLCRPDRRLCPRLSLQ